MAPAGDRLSELPVELIYHIFSFLPAKDGFRTTLVSKRLENVWRTVPCLDFDYNYHYNDQYEPDKYREFINRALIYWKGMRILKFKINFHGRIPWESYIHDFESWVCFALRKKVQRLYVHCPYPGNGEVSLPQDLYSCSSLQELSLSYCRLQSGNYVNWNQLKSLNLDDVEISEDVINQILCGSPSLEVFDLSLIPDQNMCEKLSIKSTSLKKLSIHSFSRTREFRIWTPNLETLLIWGYTCKYLLNDVPSLACVSFDCCGGDDSGEALKQILSTHVEKVTFSSDCIETLVAMNEEGWIPSSSNVKFLRLDHYDTQYEQIIRVLEILPQVETLVLDGRTNDYVEEPPLECDDAFLHSSFLQHLRTIEVTWAAGVDHLIFPFIKIVLNFAINLQKIIIRVVPSSNAPPQNLYFPSRRFLRMHRSSPTAELIFYQSSSNQTLHFSGP